MNNSLIYEVECQLDPDIVADYDAWLPGHVQAVLACSGFLGADVEAPEVPPGERPRRQVRYRVESAAALDNYLENDATRLRTETAQRFGGRVHCERRVLKPRHELTLQVHQPRRCLNCGTAVTGRYCAQCGQSVDVHVLSMKEVAGDVTHSLLHLDSRVWRTLRLLVRRPGELTREFIAGRHQLYIPPFRLYLAVSILFFALMAVLPDTDSLSVDSHGDAVVAPDSTRAAEDVGKEISRELGQAGIDVPAPSASVADSQACTVSISDDPRLDGLEKALVSACRQIRQDGGARIAEQFTATAPKLMFLFLPLMAAVALPFYRRPRRLYAEHLVLFLHNHAFTFLLLGSASVLEEISRLEFPLAGLFDIATYVLWFYLVYYVYRSMRVVYGNGRALTLAKFLAIATIYFVLLGATMLGGLLATMYRLS